MSDFVTLTTLNTSQPALAKTIINAIEQDTVLIRDMKPSTGGDSGFDFSKGGYSRKWNVNAKAMIQAHAVTTMGAVFTPTPSHETHLAEIGPATIALVASMDRTEALRATGPSSPYPNPMAYIQQLMAPSGRLLAKELEQYLFMGILLDRQVAATATTYNGITCLSPEFTGGTETGNTNGIFDLNAFADQSKTIVSLAANDAYRWATQYLSIPSFGGGVGPRIHRRIIGQMRRYARGAGRHVAYMDDASFETFLDWLDSRVTYTDLAALTKDNNLSAAKGSETGDSFMFRGIPYKRCYNIDPSQYTDATLKKGVTFFVDHNEWRGNFPTVEQIMSGMGQWVDGMKGQVVPVNMLTCAVSFTMQIWPEWLASQGLIAGGGV